MNQSTLFRLCLGCWVLVLISCAEQNPINPNQFVQLAGDSSGIQSQFRGIISELDQQSLTAAGIDFDLSNASIYDGNTQISTAQLDSGMVVNIKGKSYPALSSGVADSVNIAGFTRGRITQVNHQRQQFTLLEQKFQYDNNTIFAGLSATQLFAQRFVKVYGYRISPTLSQATRIEKITTAAANISPLALELRGIIADLDTVAQTFSIGGLVIDYSVATLLDIANGALTNDLEVSVSSTELFVGSTLIAATIEEVTPITPVDPAQRLIMEGIVTAMAAATTSTTAFVLNEQPISISANTLYRFGSFSRISVGNKLIVNGTINADGVLVAEQIEFPLDKVLVMGNIDFIAPEISTVDVLGITFTLSSDTILAEQGIGSPPKSLTLADFQAGDRVKIKGTMFNNIVTAEKIERRPQADIDNSASVTAPIEAIEPAALQVFGITANTIEGYTNFRDTADQLLDYSSFYTLIGSDTVVSILGIYSDNTIIASEIQIKELTSVVGSPVQPPEATPVPTLAPSPTPSPQTDPSATPVPDPTTAAGPPGNPVDLATLYVATNGTDSECLEQAPCNRIQAAIDRAGIQSIIFVAPGVYTENLVISVEKSGLTIMGASNKNTIIVSSDDTNKATFPDNTPAAIIFDIAAPNVTLTNLGITFSEQRSTKRDIGLLLRDTANNTALYSLLVKRLRSGGVEANRLGSQGILAFKPDSLEIVGNQIMGAFEEGLHLLTTNAIVRENIIENSTRTAILLAQYPDFIGSNMLINSNVVSNNQGDGIQIQGSDNSISSNLILDNMGIGIHLCGDLTCSNNGHPDFIPIAVNNTIEKNTFTNNQQGEIVNNGTGNVIQ